MSQQQRTKPQPLRNPFEKQKDDGSGPKRPDISVPDTSKLLKKMKDISKDNSRRYKQLPGQ